MDSWKLCIQRFESVKGSTSCLTRMVLTHVRRSTCRDHMFPIWAIALLEAFLSRLCVSNRAFNIASSKKPRFSFGDLNSSIALNAAQKRRASEQNGFDGRWVYIHFGDILQHVFRENSRLVE